MLQERKARDERAAKGKPAAKGSQSKEAKPAEEQITPEQAEERTKISVPTTGIRAAVGVVPPRPAAPRAAGVPPPPPPPPPLPVSLRRPQATAEAPAAVSDAAAGPRPPPRPPPLPCRRPGEQPCFATDRDRSESPLAYSTPKPPPPPPPLPPAPPGCQRPLSGRSSDARVTPRLGTITPSATPRIQPLSIPSPSGHPPAAHAHAPALPSPAHSRPPLCDVQAALQSPARHRPG